MSALLQVLIFVHILVVVFMAWPLYALITVNERGALGPPLGNRTDRLVENLIKAQSIRCYVYQFTALVTGLALVYFDDLGLGALLTNRVLAAKLTLLLVLMGLLSYVHFNLQPKIDALFARAGANLVPQEIAAQVGPLRVRRKKLAATCLFIVITIILLGLQVHSRFDPAVNLALLGLAALFVWHAYRTRIPYGWV